MKFMQRFENDPSFDEINASLVTPKLYGVEFTAKYFERNLMLFGIDVRTFIKYVDKSEKRILINFFLKKNFDIHNSDLISFSSLLVALNEKFRNIIIRIQGNENTLEEIQAIVDSFGIDLNILYASDSRLSSEEKEKGNFRYLFLKNGDIKTLKFAANRINEGNKTIVNTPPITKNNEHYFENLLRRVKSSKNLYLLNKNPIETREFCLNLTNGTKKRTSDFHLF